MLHADPTNSDDPNSQRGLPNRLAPPVVAKVHGPAWGRCGLGLASLREHLESSETRTRPVRDLIRGDAKRSRLPGPRLPRRLDAGLQLSLIHISEPTRPY